REARSENAFDQPRLGWLDVRGKQARCACLVGDSRQIESGTVIANLDSDFIALLPNVERNFTGFSFPGRSSRHSAFDPVVEGVAQKMLERSHEFFQHRAGDFDLCAADLQIGALVELLGGLAKDP